MGKMSCDVAVVGGGIGGLCVGARLSHAGYKTILLERAPILGGRFVWGYYKGYFLPVGAWTIYYGHKDPVLQTLKDVGVGTAFEMKPMPSTKWRIKGKDHEMPQKNLLWHIISLAADSPEEAERVVKALRRGFRWREPSDAITMSEWVLRITGNRTIYNIFEAWAVQLLGMNLWECTAGQFMREFLMFAGTEMLVPKGGLNLIIDSLARVIRDNNGEIIPLAEVRKINVHDGIANGVQAIGPDFELDIEARVVVSDVGPKVTVELVGADAFDRGYLREVGELGALDGLMFVISSDEPLYEGGLYTVETRRSLAWIDFSTMWPDMAPPGKRWIAATQAAADRFLYNPRKEYELFLADLADTFPDYRKKGAEILMVRRYTKNWPCTRSRPNAPSHRKTPVENLYNVGDAVNPPEWTAGSGVTESARIVAEDIKKRIKPSK
jgi:phytoene desaturase